MVAKITTPSSISKALNYNEKKVQKGVATCLYAGNFLKDASALNFHEKLHRFKALNKLNTRAKTNTLHISLNFDPSESFSQERLVQIASAYLAKIGFGEQPYLVYEHHDAGHPHIHIVTTTIQENGKRIDTYNIGKNQSQKVRTELELAFGLVKAGGKEKQQKKAEESPANQKVTYGKWDTKRAITNVLNAVIHSYHYTSLAELNAILRLYNLTADTGTEGSRIHRNRGLIYRILDEKGQAIGVPIKASSIAFGPTLKYLENHFKRGTTAREPFKIKLKTAIDFQLYQKPDSLTDFIRQMQSEKITVIPRHNSENFVFGLTFIDHRTKSVFNGSDLGKQYSAGGIQKRITEGREAPVVKGADLLSTQSHSAKKDEKMRPGELLAERLGMSRKEAGKSLKPHSNDLLHQLLKAEQDRGNLPYELRKKKRRKPGQNL